jgi:fatty acid synthase
VYKFHRFLLRRLGDPQEMNAITEVFCSKRNQPLLIGSTKSNMGHPEPASGVAALAKLLIAIQDGHIPGKHIERLFL